jgi:predicted neutral ceramidase superfamily lipid hydrolase
MQAALQHDQALKDAQAAAEARLAEVVEDSTNSNTVLTTELEEERKARKAAEHLIEVMTTDHKEYDRLVMQIDALALRKSLPCPFFHL